MARLDRLARNVALVSRLMESGIEFVAADMPFANKLTIHILAAVAEHEREAIIAAAKARGVKLGGPKLKQAQRHGIASNNNVCPVIEQIKGERRHVIARHSQGIQRTRRSNGSWRGLGASASHRCAAAGVLS